MPGILRMVAMLLVLAMTAALPDALAMPPVPAPAGHAAGCHGHGPANPSHLPTSYQCCVSGHHAAVPTVSFSLRGVATQVGSLDGVDGLRFALVLSVNSAVLIFPSNSPPGLTPLRI
jgi:hypothetical protein